MRIFQRMGRAVAAAFWAVVAWCAGLNLRLFLQGFPALAVGLTSVVVLTFAAMTPTQEIEGRYAERAQHATRAKDYPEALACYERLAHLQNDRSDVVYDWALAAESAGQPDRCALLMRQLAAPDRQGYPKAHLWLAVRLIAAANPTQQTRQLAETHLLRAIEGGVDDKEAAHGLLGDLYLSKGLLDQAETHLLISVKKKPQVRLRLAHLYALQSNFVRAKTEAKMAVNLYSTAAKADLFNHYARVKWAEATTFLEDFPQTVAILQEGLTGTGEPLYRSALARVYATWFDYLGRNGAGVTGQRLALLEVGLRHDPKNLALLDRLLSVTGIKHSRQVSPQLAAATFGLAGTLSPWCAMDNWIGHAVVDADAARKTLRRLLAQGEVTSQVHFALGVDAWDQGLVKDARFHWERAHQLSPATPTIANNLAWLLYQTSPGELQKALDLINVAIERAPNETSFRDTRGHILAKMGKHKEAIADLEAALPFSPNSPTLHQALAGLYANLEMPALAEEHRRLAEEKATPKKPRSR